MSLEGILIFSVVGMIFLHRLLSSLDKKNPLKNKQMKENLKKIGIGEYSRVGIFWDIIAILIILCVIYFIFGVIFFSKPGDPSDYPGEDYPINAWDR